VSDPALETELWLGTLVTVTPQTGFDLAIALARRGVTATQPDADAVMALRKAYEHDTAQLIAASQVIGVFFQTIAAANDYWRSDAQRRRPRLPRQAVATRSTPDGLTVAVPRRLCHGASHVAAPTHSQSTGIGSVQDAPECVRIEQPPGVVERGQRWSQTTRDAGR